MDAKAVVQDLIDKARIAQKEFETFSQEQVDQIVREVGKVVYDNAAELARMAVDETGMGVYEHKVTKNQTKAKVIWNDLKGRKTVGIIDRDEATGIVKVAKPMGVIGSVTPTTNPIVTPMCNIMFALKGRNAIVIGPHPRSKKCSSYTIKLINEALKKYNAPENLVQIIEEPTIELSSALMKAADVVVATGGGGMVRAAYSSGKPAYGVGPGNVQVIIDREVDFEDAVKKIIIGKTFDNGIICSGEQTVIAHEDDYDEVLALFEANNCYVVRDPAEKEAVRKTLFPDGKIISRDVVGQSAFKIAKMAGISVPEGTQALLVEADGPGAEDLVCKEKLCPVLTAFKYKTFEEAVAIGQTNLEFEGKGHTAGIYSNNIEHIEYAADKLTVSRMVVNQPTSTTAGGSFFNGFAPTTTLGCGTWGNNSISENFTYKHMINVSRLGYFMGDRVAPTDEEIWAE